MNTKDLPQWWHNRHGNVRIMTISEGYIMARRKGQEPFVRSIADFTNMYKKGKE
jgi:hypothetical protein